ncbi:MAG: hypothetical protein GY702_06540 [Desulfobulbaceae bacterium]|nr:hypothetical protein [Desulfobulbaceae bacterium]
MTNTPLKPKPGRPTVVTQSVIDKLEQAFIVDANVTQACFTAEVTRESYYLSSNDNLSKLTAFKQLLEALALKKVDCFE